MKKRMTIGIIVAIVLVAVIAGYFIISNTSSSSKQSSLITKDPIELALSQADVPSDFIINSDPSETGYKDDSYWGNESEKQQAINRGFTKGYRNTFFYQDPNALLSVKTISSSISLYSLEGAKEAFNENQQNFLEGGCTQFDVQKIGDGNFGCYEADTSSIAVKTYYYIFFYEKNVNVFVSIGQTGTVNLKDDAIKYAKVVANKI